MRGLKSNFPEPMPPCRQGKEDIMDLSSLSRCTNLHGLLPVTDLYPPGESRASKLFLHGKTPAPLSSHTFMCPLQLTGQFLPEPNRGKSLSDHILQQWKGWLYSLPSWEHLRERVLEATVSHSH